MSAHVTTDLARRRFTVEEYERMGTTGILGEDDRVELLDGEIVSMTPVAPVNAGVVDRLAQLLLERVIRRAIVRVQNPMRLVGQSEPQPDLALLRPRDDFYTGFASGAGGRAAGHRGGRQLHRHRPGRQGAAVRRRWHPGGVDRRPVGGRVIVHREPDDGVYTRIDIARSGGTVKPTAFPDLALAVDEILGT